MPLRLQRTCIERIVQGLFIESNVEIDPANALIVLDEIQEVPAVLQSLNYFTENEQQSYTILAGDSLLGIALHQGTSYPVGKVDTMNLYPLSFPEFLNATGSATDHKKLADDQNLQGSLHRPSAQLLLCRWHARSCPFLCRGKELCDFDSAGGMRGLRVERIIKADRNRAALF